MQNAGIVDLFSYFDFEHYKNGDYVSANFLYGIFIKAIGATSIGDPRLFTLGIITAILVDILTLYLFSKYFLISCKTLIIFGVFSFILQVSYACVVGIVGGGVRGLGANESLIFMLITSK